MSNPRDWDGATYDRISAPQHGWGKEVLERLPLRGDETVLDAGCGSGRVTELLVQRLPRGRVIAVDASPSMAAAARERLGEHADVRVMDLQELELEVTLDAILSTATFHWISDHERLFARLHAALLPGGRLVAQCGGEGNVQRTRAAAEEVSAREPFAPYMRGWPGPWNFSSAELAQERLLAAGLRGRAAGSTTSPSTRPSRGSSCAASTSARTCSGCPTSCASRSWTLCMRSSASPIGSTMCG